MTVEGYHPLSSYLFFNIEKPCFAIEHANNVNSLCFITSYNLISGRSTTLFEFGKQIDLDLRAKSAIDPLQ